MIHATMTLRSGKVKFLRRAPRVDELGADILRHIVSFVTAPEEITLTGLMDAEERTVQLETLCDAVHSLNNFITACTAFRDAVDKKVWFDMMFHFIPRSPKVSYNVEFQDKNFHKVQAAALRAWRRDMHYRKPKWAVPTNSVRYDFYVNENGRNVWRQVQMCIRLWFVASMHDRVTATECANLYGLRRNDRAALKSVSKPVKNWPWACKLYSTRQVTKVARAKHGAHRAGVSETALRAACNALGVPSMGDKRKLLERLNVHVAMLHSS
jgi:hypothetical protein